MTFQWILLVVLLACSGFVSGSETALFGLSQIHLRQFASSGGPLRRQAWQLMQHPRRVLMTVLIANTAINVLFFSTSYVLFENLGQTMPGAAPIGGVAALIAVIMFGEILPKAVARSHAARFAPLVAPGLRALQVVLTPVEIVLRVALVEPLTRLLQTGRPPRNEVDVDELKALVEMSARQGVIDSAENRMLQEIVALPDVKVRSIMQPRVSVIAAPLDEDPPRVLAKLQEARLTKLPVYGQDLDDVRGLVSARDLHFRPDAPLGKLLKPVQFVPEQVNLLQLIDHFRRTHTQLGIVVDEFGGMAGLVTLHDVLETIVGDLGGRERPAQPAAEAIDDNTYRLAGDLSIRDWAQRFGLSLRAGSAPAPIRFETLAGLVLSLLGRLPTEGDSVQVQNLTLTVERMDGRRIERILLKRHRPSADPQCLEHGDGGPP